MKIGHFVGTLGRGLAAGLIGTGVMTLAQMLEMKLSGRAPSDVPVKAVEKTLSIEVSEGRAEQRLGELTHFAYGTGWGLVRGAMSGAGMRGTTATSLHAILVWSAALVMLPRLGLASPVREWTKAQVAEDLGFHALYAVATGAAFEWLEKRS